MPQRFGAARPKIQWKAADSAGREFGNDPEMKLIPRKLRHKIKHLIRKRDRKRAQEEEKARMKKIIDAANSHTPMKRRSWSAGSAVSRAFSSIRPDRPQTAHERMLAERYRVPDRTLNSRGYNGLPWYQWVVIREGIERERERERERTNATSVSSTSPQPPKARLGRQKL